MGRPPETMRGDRGFGVAARLLAINGVVTTAEENYIIRLGYIAPVQFLRKVIYM